MYEKRLKAVSPKLFTADGTVDGKILLANTRFFKVKQKVTITANALPNLELEIKRIDDSETMYVGPIKGNIDSRSDISAYVLASNASVFANEQLRPSIPEQEIERLTYEEEPTVARRVALVDPLGNKYDNDNPLPVQVDTTVNIGDVRITAANDDPNTGNIHSSVRIGDGVDELAINPDGSINVVIPPNAGSVSVSEFNEIAAVPANSLTTIISYTVPVGFNGNLLRVEVGGNNVATYELYVNGDIEARTRTWFGTSLTQTMEFGSGSAGFKLMSSDVVEVKVIHSRPFDGDFESRVQIQLV